MQLIKVIIKVNIIIDDDDSDSDDNDSDDDDSDDDDSDDDDSDNKGNCRTFFTIKTITTQQQRKTVKI